MNTRNPYLSDVSDEEWAFVAPYLTLLPEDAGQRHYDLRKVYNGLRWMMRTAASWRMVPHDLPLWYIVYQQTQRWLAAGCFEAMVEDLLLLLRGVKGRKGQPSAAIFDSRVQEATSQSVEQAFVDQGYTGDAQLPRLKSMESSWKSSNYLRPSAVLFCCPGAG